MTVDYRIHTGSGAQLTARLDEITNLYTRVYAEPPYNSGSLYARDSFTARTQRQAQHDGCTAALAESEADGSLIGFAFGLPFQKGKWWAGEATPPPPTVLSSPKFAVIELVVDKSWRGRGIGRQLLDALLHSRTEPYAILTAVPDAPARRIYEHWGWQQIGTARHKPDADIMDQLVLDRREREGARPR